MHVVVVGGGFGGIRTALQLIKVPDITVTLISDKEDFVYYPALYSVATGGSQRQSFVPLQQIFEGTRVKVVHDRVTGYDPRRRTVRGKVKEYPYGRLVFALGAVTNYFGIKGLEHYSYGIKSHDEIVAFRRHLHDEMTSSRKLDKQYVIVGAGATGVELSASLASYIDHIAAAHDIHHSRIRIKLVEAADRVMPRMSVAASKTISKRLKSLGVDIMTNEKVEWQDDDEVFVSGKSIPTHTVVWTSGVANNPFFEQHSHYFTFSPNKKVIVDSHLMSDRYTYVIGDNAFTPYSGLAQTALYDADFVSNDITRVAHSALRMPYQPKQPPVVIPVGRSWALFEWNALRVHGYLGHLIRRAADLIGYYDILPLFLALKVWQSDKREADPCEICKKYI